MKNTKSQLGETELEVMNHVWEMKRATVSDVLERILKERKVAYTTIMTVMKNLSEKGFLKIEKEGSAFVYLPVKKEEQVKQNLLSGLIEKVFKGSPSALLQTLVKNEKLTETEIEELKSIIKNLESNK